MRAKVDFRVEIVEGPDAGYVLEEHNKLLDLEGPLGFGYDVVHPYRLTMEFITPSMWREKSEKEIKTNFYRYLNEQMKDPEFREAYKTAYEEILAEINNGDGVND